MPLVKLSHGASLNPDSLKYITIDPKNIEGEVVYGIMVRIDDNTEHWITGYSDRNEAIAQVKDYAQKINAAEDM